MKKGFLFYHQAWTDIINCMALIKYYSDQYDEISVVNRSDVKNIIDFFTRNMKNVKKIYIDKQVLDDESAGKIHLLDYLKENNQISFEEYDLLIHGFPDHYRKDSLKSIYPKLFNNYHFVKGFYASYQISSEYRYQLFEFVRDHEIENRAYEEFISIHGKDYILYHEDVSRNMGYPLPVVKDSRFVNLHGMADNIFSTIKILENAKEIHLIDSVWASFCYIIDAKYGILSDKDIKLYPLINRPGGCLDFIPNRRFSSLEPKNLKNWKIINYY